MLKWHKMFRIGTTSLRVKLLAPLLAFGTLAGGIGAWLIHASFRAKLEGQMMHRAEVVMHAVSYAAETARTRSDISRFVTAMGGDMGVQLIVVTTGEPPCVAASTRLSWVGQMLDSIEDTDVVTDMGIVFKTRQAQRHHDEDINAFDLLAPLLLSLEDMPSLQLDHGVVMVRLDAAPIQRELSRAMWRLVGYLAGLVCGLTALTYLLVHLYVLRPAYGITRAMAERAQGNSSAYAPVLASDEMGSVAGTLNEMLDALTKQQGERDGLHRQLVEMSRQAGMAEIATGVLHNVGNVLNSVNVSTSVVSEKVRKTPVGGLQKLTALLKEHEDNLGDFLTQNDKGRQVTAFLAALSEHLLGEQVSVLNEMDALSRNVEHIKQIVAVQQSHAKAPNMSELVQLSAVLEDAVRINEVGLRKAHVEIERSYEPMPPLFMDKHKVMQIAVNLISNARHAIAAADKPDGKLTLRIARGGESADRVIIQVIDNGVGMTSETLEQSFSLGFTTRKDGHGFGLHSSALAARMLGGLLTAQSAGRGRGATLTLELPLAQEGVANER